MSRTYGRDCCCDLFACVNQVGQNFSNYDKIQVNVSGLNAPNKIDSFASSGLDPIILQNLEQSKFTIPTPCQKYAIPCILAGKDVMCCAQTGSGKTAAFLLPLIHMIKENDLPKARSGPCQKPKVLVLSPTRELALQIFNNYQK